MPIPNRKLGQPLSVGSDAAVSVVELRDDRVQFDVETPTEPSKLPGAVSLPPRPDLSERSPDIRSESPFFAEFA